MPLRKMWLQSKRNSTAKSQKLEKMRVRGEGELGFLDRTYFQRLSDNYNFLDSLYVFLPSGKQKILNGEILFGEIDAAESVKRLNQKSEGIKLK